MSMPDAKVGDYLPDAVSRLGGGRGGDCFLAGHHLEAARRLVRLFDRARIRQRVTMSYDPARIGGSQNRSGQSDMSDSAAQARQMLGRLAQRLPGDCWGVLTDICGFEKGLQQIEHERGWPRRSAKLVLRIGLDQLASLMKLSEEARGLEKAGVQSWLPERMPMFPEAAS